MGQNLFYSTSFVGADTTVGATAVDDWTQYAPDGAATYFKSGEQARGTRKIDFPRLMRPAAATFADSVIECRIPPNNIYTTDAVRMSLHSRHNNSDGTSYEFFVEPNTKRIRLDRYTNFSTGVALTSNPTDLNLSYVSFATYDVTKSYLMRFATYGSNPTNLLGQLYLLDASNVVVSKVAEVSGTDTTAALQSRLGTAAFNYYKFTANSTPVYFDDFKWYEVTGATIEADYPEAPAANPGPTFVTSSANTVAVSGGSTNQITASFQDADGVPETGFSTALEVVSPNATVLQATFVSSSLSGTTRTGIWTAPAPGGTYDEGDNGSYTYRLKASQIRDSLGNFAAAQNLGSFSVSIPPAGGGTADLAANDTKFVRSANWYDRGNGIVDTNYLGAYIKGSFTGATLSIKTTNLDNKRSFVCQINGGAFVKYTPGAGAQTLLLASGLGAGTHKFRVVYDEREVGFVDRWNNPEMVVTAFNAASFVQESRLTGDVFIYGDSIMQYDVYSQSAIQGIGFAIGEASGHEFACKAFGGTGWKNLGAENAPNIESSWDFQRSGIALQYSGAPAWVLINMGTNDGGFSASSVQTAIQNTVSAMRSRSGWSSVPLLIQVPFKQTFITTIDAAITTLNNVNTKKVNAGAHLNRNLSGTGGYYATDGLHPNPVAHAALTGGTLLSVGKALSTTITQGGGGTGTSPTTAEIAAAVKTALDPQLNAIPTSNPTSAQIATAVKSTLDPQLNAIPTTTLTTIQATQLKLAAAKVTNRIRINTSLKTETLYDDNGTTVLVTKALKGSTGLPDSEKIYEVIPT